MNKDEILIVYRQGNPNGWFYATNKEYYGEKGNIHFWGSYNEYAFEICKAKVWYVFEELEKEMGNDFAVIGWDYIQVTQDWLDKQGLIDECDWDLLEKLGVTSTDALAQLGKRKGYDATYFNRLPQPSGEEFDEIAIYNHDLIHKVL